MPVGQCQKLFQRGVPVRRPVVNVRASAAATKAVTIHHSIQTDDAERHTRKTSETL